MPGRSDLRVVGNGEWVARVRTIRQDAVADLAAVRARSRWVRSRGIRLHLLDYGGSGPPMVVLPGITSPAVTLDFVVRELSDLVRPIVVDVRGRGLSDSAPSYTLADYADDVVAVLDEVAGARSLLLGHSMGARIASVVACRDLQLLGTVVVEPPMSGPGRAPYPFALPAFLTEIAAAREGIADDQVARAWPRWPSREQELRARWLSTCDEQAVAASYAGFEGEDFFTSWASVRGPAALLYGGDSSVVTPDGLAEARLANPTAELLEIPGAGHMVFWDNPVAAISLIRRVLGRLL